MKVETCTQGHPKTAENRDTRGDCRPCRNIRSSRSVKRLKDRVIAAYGGVCACCGEGERLFLTLDHLNNDGNAHRRVAKSSKYAYIDAERNPEKYQVLCFNCNCGRVLNGGRCPHD